MKSQLKVLGALITGLSVLTLVAGCNIFDFTSDTEKSPIEKAENDIRDGKYEQAKKDLSDAVKDSTNSMALYLNAKATLLSSDIDISKVLDLVEGQSNLSDGSDLAILDFVNTMQSNDERTSWYRSNMEVAANLKKIVSGNTTGILKKDDILLDYSISNMITGVLGLRDTDRDGYITSNDFVIDLSFLNNAGNTSTDGFAINGFTVDGEMKDGLLVFLGDLAASKTANVKSSYTPDKVNELISFAINYLNNGNISINEILADQTSFNKDDISKYINEIGAVINFYWYNDGRDNDHDNRFDEEIIDGVDNDEDGLIDEDTDYMDASVISNTHLWKQHGAQYLANKTDNKTGEAAVIQLYTDLWNIILLNSNQ